MASMDAAQQLRIANVLRHLSRRGVRVDLAAVDQPARLVFTGRGLVVVPVQVAAHRARAPPKRHRDALAHAIRNHREAVAVLLGGAHILPAGTSLRRAEFDVRLAGEVVTTAVDEDMFHWRNSYSSFVAYTSAAGDGERYGRVQLLVRFGGLVLAFVRVFVIVVAWERAALFADGVPRSDMCIVRATSTEEVVASAQLLRVIALGRTYTVTEEVRRTRNPPPDGVCFFVMR